MARAPVRPAKADDQAAAKKQGYKLPVLRIVLLVLFLISIYLEVPLYITGDFFIPSVFTMLFLTPVLAIMYRKRIYKYEAVFIGLIFLVFLLTALLSPGYEYLNQKLLGLVQTMISIVGGVLLVKLLRDLPRQWIAKTLLAFSVLLLLGTALEVAGVLSGVSDAFREIAYGRGDGYEVYEAAGRDAEILGFVRPKFFTSEPSLLAIGFFVFVNSWLLLSYSKRNLLLACVGALFMLFLTGSPILLISLMVSLAIVFFHRDSVIFIPAVAVLVLGVGLVLVLARPDIASQLFSRISGDLGTISVLNPSSEVIRLVFPFITLVDVLQESPLFGVGISGKEMIGDFSSLPVDPELALGTNNFALMFIYLGLLGALLFIKVFRDYLRKMRIAQVALLVILILALSQTMGGFETLRFWGYAFLFIGVMKVRSDARP